MNSSFLESRQALQQARDALRNGDRSEARRWAEKASQLAPDSEDPWLILAAVASPRASVDYIKKVLAINPDSPRARKGMEWAMQRLRGETPETSEAESEPGSKTQPTRPARSGDKKRGPWFAIFLFLLGCLVIGLAAWSASTSPVLASILSLSSAPQARATQVTHPQSFAQVDIPKPTYTPTSISMVEVVLPTATPSPDPVQDTATPTSVPTDTPAPLPTATLLSPDTTLPTDTPATVEPLPTNTPEVAALPGVMEAAIVPDTPTSEYAAPTSAPAASDSQPQPQPQAVNAANGQRWIDVDLSQQRVYAYEGNTVVNSFIVSTGVWQTPTVTGQYHIYVKLLSTTMTGPGYYLPNVPYTMYFYQGYGLHGTYWHHNFGTPMSHGCVNLSIPDSEWLYNFASVGTLVNVHY